MKFLKYVFATVLTLCTCLCSTTTAYAETVYDEDADIGTRETEVSFSVKTFTIKLPKSINSEASVVNYEAGVKGSLAEGCSLYIKPAESFVLTNELGLTATADVAQDKITWLPSEITAEEYNCGEGTITASLAVGDYTGSLQFGIGVRIPGLYKPDGTFVSWDALVADGTVIVEGGWKVTGTKQDIAGDLVLPSTHSSIGQSAFTGRTGLTSIYIPKSIGSIQWYAFNGCPNLTLIYDEESYTYSQKSAFQAAAGANGITFSTEWWKC